jgi:anti-sigma B factor antagonist
MDDIRNIHNRLVLKVRRNRSVYVVDIAGELNLYTAYRLRDLFTKMVEKNVSRFIFNLEEVAYIDSSGLGILMYISSAVRKMELRASFANIKGVAAKILDITRLMESFPVAENLEAALLTVGA